MKPRPRNRSAGFTLLELVVVLAVLAVVTGLAVRSLQAIDDGHRDEGSVRLLTSIEGAVLGDHQAAGFVSDLGRLPVAVGEADFSLAELWRQGGLPSYDLRRDPVDPEVAVPCGWRGPYLSLPVGGDTLRDPWGNPVASAVGGGGSDAPYARLRTEADEPIQAAGVPVGVVRLPGANGVADPGDAGVERDLSVVFAGRHQAWIKAVVTVVDAEGVADAGGGGESVVVRVFAPDAALPGMVSVVANEPAVGLDASATATVPQGSVLPEGSSAPATPSGLGPVSIGVRPVRAYLLQAGGAVVARSQVSHVTLRPGVNVVNLVIRRP